MKRIKLPNGSRVTARSDPVELALQLGPGLNWDLNASLPPAHISTPPIVGSYRPAGTGITNLQRLIGQPVIQLGGGSMGSYLGYFLGIAQLELHLFDYKDVLPHHTQDGRTIYELDLIGKKKVEAAKLKIERDYPGTVVHPYPCNVAEIPDREWERMFGNSVLVIVAIDDPSELLRISDLAYKTVELIQVAMHAGALSGHIAISVPYATPCLRCTLEVTNSSEIRRLDHEMGSSWHIRRVAHEAATIAIDLMCSKLSGEPITSWDTSKNLVYITNQRQELSPDGPGMCFEGSQKRPGCPICHQF